MRATCSHEVVFDNVLVPLDHAVSVSRWSAPQPELDGDGLLWMSVLLSSVYDGVAQAARDWLVGWLEDTQAVQPRRGVVDPAALSGNRRPHRHPAVRQPQPARRRRRGPHPGQPTRRNLKYLVTGNAIRAVELAIEASGNPGLSRNNPLQRHYRDVLCSRVHTPQNDAVLQGVGKAVFAQRQQKERP